MAKIRYNRDQIYVGMKNVKASQLSNIFNVWIYLKDYNSETGGEIALITDKDDDDRAIPIMQGGHCMPVYNSQNLLFDDLELIRKQACQ